MNRKLLFKAKRLDNGEWVEGSLINTEMGVAYIIRSKSKAFIPKGKNIICSAECYEINPETLCQYTGLTDKNGRKIWENDICEMVYDGVVNTYVIIWDKDELDFKGTNGKENYANNFEYLGCCEEIVVIGNIFDNPELVEVE